MYQYTKLYSWVKIQKTCSRKIGNVRTVLYDIIFYENSMIPPSPPLCLVLSWFLLWREFCYLEKSKNDASENILNWLLSAWRHALWAFYNQLSPIVWRCIIDCGNPSIWHQELMRRQYCPPLAAHLLAPDAAVSKMSYNGLLVNTISKDVIINTFFNACSKPCSNVDGCRWTHGQNW